MVILTPKTSLGRAPGREKVQPPALANVSYIDSMTATPDGERLCLRTRISIDGADQLLVLSRDFEVLHTITVDISDLLHHILATPYGLHSYDDEGGLHRHQLRNDGTLSERLATFEGEEGSIVIIDLVSGPNGVLFAAADIGEPSSEFVLALDGHCSLPGESVK